MKNVNLNFGNENYNLTKFDLITLQGSQHYQQHIYMINTIDKINDKIIINCIEITDIDSEIVTLTYSNEKFVINSDSLFHIVFNVTNIYYTEPKKHSRNYIFEGGYVL